MFKSITMRLFLLVLCASLVPILAMSYWGFSFGETARMRAAMTVLHYIAEYQIHSLDLVRNELSDAAREFLNGIDPAVIVAELAAAPDGEPKVSAQLAQFLEQHERSIHSAWIYAADGSLIGMGATSGKASILEPVPDTHVTLENGFNLRAVSIDGALHWATELAAAGNSGYSVLMVSRSQVGEAASALGVLLPDPQDGVIGPIILSSRRLIIDSEGRIVSARRGTEPMDVTGDAPELPTAVRKALAARAELQADYTLPDGTRALGVVHHHAASGLGFVIEVDRSLLAGGSQALFIGILVGSLIAIGSAFVIVIFLGRRITRPVRELVAATSALSLSIDPSRKLPAHDPNDEIASLSAVFGDMVDTVKASQAELRDSEAKFVALTGQPVLGIMFVGQNGILYANSALATIMGCKLADVGPTMADFLALIEAEDRSFVCPGGSGSFTLAENCWFRTTGADGAQRWIHMLTRPVELSGESVYLIMCIDVSEQKRYEREIRDQKLYLENLIEAIADPFYVIDAASREVVMANRAARELQNNPNVDTCFALNPCSTPCSRKNHLCPFELSRLTKLSSTVEQIHYDENRRKRYIEVHGHPVLDKDGAVVQVIEYQLDITSRKRAENALRESEQRYSSLFENNHSVMMIVDPESRRIVDANPAACQFYGYAHEKITNMLLDQISQTEPAELEESLQLARDSRRNHFHTDHRLASGEVRHVEAFSGPILLGGRNLIYAIVHDVSQRVSIERELKRRYEAETLAAALATRFINPQSEEIDREINAAMREIGEFAGVDRCQLIEFTADLSRVSNAYQWFRDLPDNSGLKLENLNMRQFPWASRRITQLEPLVINSVRDLPAEAAAEMQAFAESGTRSLIAIPLHAGTVLLGTFVIQTTTDERTWDASDVLLMRVTGELLVNVLVRRRYEGEIAHSRNRLKDLSAHIQDRIESERASIAREVHDELGQLLTALKFDISWLKNKVPEDNPALVDKSRIMSEIIDEAVRCVQRITSELRPVLLDDLGIAAAIDWLAREFSERTGIVSHLELDEIDAEGPMAITLFRITQEALTNVGRHSFATELDISLKSVSGGVRLEIRDNGVGISETQLTDPTSYGLLGIQERAGFLDGTVSIRGSKGEGTRIEVFIPVKKKRKTQ